MYSKCSWHVGTLHKIVFSACLCLIIAWRGSVYKNIMVLTEGIIYDGKKKMTKAEAETRSRYAVELRGQAARKEIRHDDCILHK